MRATYRTVPGKSRHRGRESSGHWLLPRKPPMPSLEQQTQREWRNPAPASTPDAFAVSGNHQSQDLEALAIARARSSEVSLKTLVNNRSIAGVNSDERRAIARRAV